MQQLQPPALGQQLEPWDATFAHSGDALYALVHSTIDRKGTNISKEDSILFYILKGKIAQAAIQDQQVKRLLLVESQQQEQLTAKDAEIAQLKQQLAHKDSQLTQQQQQHLAQKASEIAQLKQQLTEKDSQLAQQQQHIKQQQIEIAQLKPNALLLCKLKPTLKLWSREMIENKAYIAELQNTEVRNKVVMAKQEKDIEKLQVQLQVLEQLLAVHKSAGPTCSLPASASKAAAAAATQPTAAVGTGAWTAAQKFAASGPAAAAVTLLARQSAAGREALAKLALPPVAVRPKLERVDSVVMPSTPNQGSSRGPSDSNSSNNTVSSGSWFGWLSETAVDSSNNISTAVNNISSNMAGATDGLCSWWSSAANLLATAVSSA